MRRMRYLLLITTIACSVYLGSTGPGRAMEPADHSIYAELLRKYVVNGEVDYGGFKKEAGKLDQYLDTLEKVDTQKLSRSDQLAFYINAYNAWTIKLVLGGYPKIKSIKELTPFWTTPWKQKVCRVDGQLLSLDDIEHGIIRPRFKDPRIHFAVNCASKSCPPLISEPYLGGTLEQQLNQSTKAFINNPAMNRLTGKTLYVSKIFSWYGEDFTGGVVAFFLSTAEGDLKKGLESHREQIKIEFLDYDWALNGK